MEAKHICEKNETTARRARAGVGVVGEAGGSLLTVWTFESCGRISLPGPLFISQPLECLKRLAIKRRVPHRFENYLSYRVINGHPWHNGMTQWQDRRVVEC